MHSFTTLGQRKMKIQLSILHIYIYILKTINLYRKATQKQRVDERESLTTKLVMNTSQTI